MQFGYFTLSDNRYPDNPRSAESFIKDIYAEALWAEKVGLNIGHYLIGEAVFVGLELAVRRMRELMDEAR